MKVKILLILTAILSIFLSCNKGKTGPPIVTDQIVYTVDLKNPDSVPDMRHQYMDDTTRIHFLKNIIDPVLAGDVKAYVAEEKFRPASIEELKKRFIWDKTKMYPPDIDTINYLVHLNRITKIRYFEEWSMHRKSLLIDKRILGYSLIQDNYDDKGVFRGTEPLFYIFFDKDFADKMSKK